MNLIVEHIIASAKLQTSNPIMQQILIDFASEQAIEAQKIVLYNMRSLVPVEQQVLLMLEGIVQRAYKVDKLRIKDKHKEYVEPRQVLSFLGNYFLNTYEANCELNERLRKSGVINGTYSTTIRKFLSLSQHGTVINNISQVRCRMATDVDFKDKISGLIKKSEKILNDCYV